MPTTWGRGKTALLVGPDGGALKGIADVVKGVGFRVVTTPHGAAISRLLEDEHVGVVYVDATTMRNALSIVGALRASQAEVPVVLVRTSPSSTDVTDAVRAGAGDFLSVGVDGPTLLSRLHDAVTHVREPSANAPAAPGTKSGATVGPGALIGSSAAMRRLFSLIERIARFKTSVLILGESGSGKELVARAIHLAGPRKDQAFVPVNCATLGKDLLENELFGHERGAFTGAHTQKKGLFEVAGGGTIFLDEIGEMDPGTQAKLLRVLERSEIRRVGGTTKVKIDVNIVAATNQDLRNAIACGKFREDLFYRLRVVTIVVPPLRDHREDIPALVETFITDFNRRHGGKIRGVTPEAMRRLIQHSWPGNVRELKNVIESGAMLAEGDLLEERLLDEAVGLDMKAENRPRPAAAARADAVRRSPRRTAVFSERLELALPMRLADIERAVILRTVKEISNRREAALELGIGLRTLYGKLRSYGVREVENDGVG